MLERFVDEMLPNINFSYLRAESRATIEAAEPTLFHLTDCSGYRFSRVLLPLRGNGQVNLLIGAFDNVQTEISKVDPGNRTKR
jgi:hypothetical protein